MLQNTGAVISIAFVLAIITAAVPKTVLFKIFSGLASGLSDAQLDPFIHNMHIGAVGAGRRVAARRRGLADAPGRSAERRGGRAMSATTAKRLRIGELAELTGTTPRTIRYYEEIGLLAAAEERQQGKRRLYVEADVERLREIIRLRDLLGLTLEELTQLVEAEDARAALRRELQETDDAGRQHEILEEALGHICTS